MFELSIIYNTYILKLLKPERLNPLPPIAVYVNYECEVYFIVVLIYVQVFIVPFPFSFFTWICFGL